MTSTTHRDSASTPFRVIHTMLRVSDIERSLAFYLGTLGMTLFRRDDYPEGRFTLAFVGYGNADLSATIELTHNWDGSTYDTGSAFGHIALAVVDAPACCARLEARGVPILRAAGPMTYRPAHGQANEIIAFIADPDGYRIELIEQRR